MVLRWLRAHTRAFVVAAVFVATAAAVTAVLRRSHDEGVGGGGGGGGGGASGVCTAMQDAFAGWSSGRSTQGFVRVPTEEAAGTTA